jgi:hypothetical protein
MMVFLRFSSRSSVMSRAVRYISTAAQFITEILNKTRGWSPVDEIVIEGGCQAKPSFADR